MLGVRWMTRSLAIGSLVLLAALLALAGIAIAAAQHVAIATWRPTPAEVTSVTIEQRERRQRRSSRTYTVHIPKITYRYAAQGGAFQSSDLTYLPPLNQGFRRREDALRVVGGVQVGDSVSAFVHPDDPSRAFLHATAQGWPYAMIFLGVAIACGAAWSFMLGRSTRVEMPTLVAGSSPPLFRIAIARPMRDRAAAGITTGSLGVLLTLATLPSMVLLSVHETTRMILPACTLLAACATLGRGFWAWRAWRTFQDPSVLLAGNAIALGSPAVVVVEQPVRVGRQPEDVLVGLICTRSVASRGSRGRRTISRVVEHETWASLVAPSDANSLPSGLSLATHHTLRGVVQLLAPSTRSPTSPPDAEGNRVDWMIVVKASIAGDADSVGHYPVLVVEQDVMTSNAASPPLPGAQTQGDATFAA